MKVTQWGRSTLSAWVRGGEGSGAKIVPTHLLIWVTVTPVALWMKAVESPRSRWVPTRSCITGGMGLGVLARGMYNLKLPLLQEWQRWGWSLFKNTNIAHFSRIRPNFGGTRSQALHDKHKSCLSLNLRLGMRIKILNDCVKDFNIKFDNEDNYCYSFRCTFVF